MKYDDYSWHCEGKFPSDLAPEAGATHIGMFLSWCILSGLGGEIHHDKGFNEDSGLQILQAKKTTPGMFLIEYCDGKFTNDDLNDEGELFTAYYFSTHKYTKDYNKTLAAGLKTEYHVEDSWKNFEILKPVLDQKLEKWRSKPKSIISKIFGK